MAAVALYLQETSEESIAPEEPSMTSKVTVAEPSEGARNTLSAWKMAAWTHMRSEPGRSERRRRVWRAL
jgi:hypothetical protein